MSASIFINRGNAHAAKGDHDSAIADYNKALQLNPKHVGALDNRGDCHMQKGEYSKAAADYSAAVDSAPTLAIAKDLAKKHADAQLRSELRSDSPVYKSAQEIKAECEKSDRKINNHIANRNKALRDLFIAAICGYGGAIVAIILFMLCPEDGALPKLCTVSGSENLHNLPPLAVVVTFIILAFYLRYRANERDLENERKRQDKLEKLYHDRMVGVVGSHQYPAESGEHAAIKPDIAGGKIILEKMMDIFSPTSHTQP